jgi:hypothetical protein
MQRFFVAIRVYTDTQCGFVHVFEAPDMLNKKVSQKMITRYSKKQYVLAFLCGLYKIC